MAGKVQSKLVLNPRHPVLPPWGPFPGHPQLLTTRPVGEGTSLTPIAVLSLAQKPPPPPKGANLPGSDDVTNFLHAVIPWL